MSASRELTVLHVRSARPRVTLHAYTPKADQCRACGLCVDAYPEKAITPRRA